MNRLVVSKRRAVNFKNWGLAFVCLLTGLLFSASRAAEPDRFEFKLNGLTFVIDAQSGSLLKIASPKFGTFLETTSERAGIIDLAYPVAEFQPLRLGARFSKNVKIKADTRQVTLEWESLGASRELPLPGKISASVRFIAAPDGESVLVSATIRNQCPDSIRQVLFPDFAGIIPFAGENTRFRTAAFTENLFELLKPKPENVPFYAVGPFRKGNGWIEYTGGGPGFSKTPANWVDIGSLAGGISFFPKRWGPDEPKSAIMVHRSEVDGTLRFLYAHNQSIAPGATWTSDEYCLTPHAHGWAEGIRPLHAWLKQNWRRKYPIPPHVKNGLGFRSVWLAKGIPGDPQDVIWTYRDLPKLAQESREHGLDEMVLWFWSPAFQLPIEPIPALGTEQELVDAIAECKKIGVNVNLFISVLFLANPSAGHYGLVPVKEQSWTYHPELIPRFGPPYADWNWTAKVNPSNLPWQKDVLASFKKYIDLGLTSFVWDVYPPSPHLYALTRQIRDLAFQRDSSAVFAAEGRFDVETESALVDYTWNWNWFDYEDFRPYHFCFPVPRLNTNIDESPRSVKLCFADNTYMNIMPSAPDAVNASDLIVNHPALSTALKNCARLRAQFQDYFHSGKPIGDCLLARECTGAHVSTFLLEKKALMLLIKTDGAGSVDFAADLAHWLPARGGKYQVKIYNEAGEILAQRKISSGEFNGTTGHLGDLEVRAFELTIDN